MSTKKWVALATMALLALTGCGGDDDNPPGGDAGPPKTEVLESYAEVVYQNYGAALDTAVALKTAIDTFVSEPSQANLDAAKEAWLAARIPYGQTEAFRFQDGPIDDENGPEGQLNAWPLDEQFIDYVEGADTAGIVNDTSIEITKDRLAGLTEGGEGDVLGVGAAFDPDKAISTGYHAIEFLLWGQDLSAAGPGARPWQDYLTTVDATHPNGDRRGAYLQTVAELLVDDLTFLVAAWAPDGDNYRATFVASDPDVAIRTILTAIAILSKGELGGERMDVALDSLDQEDEHSCFSDNTHVDIAMNAKGVENVYLGRYGSYDGVGIDELVDAADPAVNEKMKELLSTSLAMIDEIPAPFDQAIATNGSDDWNRVSAAVDALFDQGDHFVVVGETLGLGTISAELPE